MASATAVEEAKSLIAELCATLYSQGHVSGTGGGISIKVGDAIVMAPSGVQKERMRAEDMFVLDAAGEVVHTPEARPPPYKAPKLSECAPLFMSVRPLAGSFQCSCICWNGALLPLCFHALAGGTALNSPAPTLP